MIAIIRVFRFQPHRGVVVVIKQRLSWFENRNALPMYTGRIKQEGCSSRSENLDDLLILHRLNLCVVDILRMLFLMATLDVVEGTAINVGQINCELYLFRDIVNQRLVVPCVTVPAMKVSFGRY